MIETQKDKIKRLELRHSMMFPKPVIVWPDRSIDNICPNCKDYLDARLH